MIIVFVEMLGAMQILNEHLLPRPSNVIQALYTQRSFLMSNMAYTLLNAMIGFLLSVIIGIFLAISIDRFAIAKSVIVPFMTISQNIPILAIAPLFVIWFGFGILSKVVIILIVCVFPITLSFYEGLSQTPDHYLSFFNTIQASTYQKYRYIKIPFSLPYLFSGLKIALTYALLAAIIAEWSGGNKGIGIYLLMAQKSFQITHFFSAIFVIVIVSLSLVALLGHIENRIYQRRSKL